MDRFQTDGLSRRKGMAFAIILSVFIVSFFGCSSTKVITVTIPPKFDLKQFKTIGVVDFASTGEADLSKKLTQKFIQTLQEAQPGVMLLELGDVQNAVGTSVLDASAVKAIKEKHGVEAVIYGQMNISKAKTKIKASLSISKLSAKKEVHGMLQAKVYHAESGAIAWTKSTEGSWTLGHLSATSFGVNNKDDKYNEMLQSLVFQTTHDFRPTKGTKRVPK